MRREPDPQELIPEGMRDSWVAVPRSSLYQLVLVGAILGAGAAVSVVAIGLDAAALRCAFPIAVVLAWLQNRLPWERRALSQLPSRRDQA